ncbi:MAG: cache domain-containing protein [Treponema sp.]|nr:cache domain-containing protein [Treponema sp.]
MSLLIAVVFFAGFTVLAFTGLFDLVESRFYSPSVLSALTREVNADAQAVDKFITELENRFSVTLQADSVKRSFLPNQSAEDIFERSRIYGMLLESLGGFQGVRFIDNGGTRIHFSTYPGDILRQDSLSAAYRGYEDSNFPYNLIAASDLAGLKLIFDEKGGRILFSFPFYDSFDVFHGTALFSLSIRAMADRLLSERRIMIGETISVLSEPQGIVLGVPPLSENTLIPGIASVWNEGILPLTRMDSVSGSSLALLSVQTFHGFFLGSLINENRFVFPRAMKIILLCAFFLTVYLTIFLFFNLRQDSFTIVQNRLKQLQISLIEQFYDRKNDMDWGRWSRELEQRREEIRRELRQGIKTGSKSKAGTGEKDDIDVLIDKSWDELLAVIGGRRDKASILDEEKLQTILSRLLAAGASIPPPAAGGNAPSGAPVRAMPPEDAEEPEDAGAAGIPEPVEISNTELSVEEVDKIMAAEPTEPAELEELGEPEELDRPAEEASSAESPEMTRLDLANLESQIEFSSSPWEEGEDAGLEKEMEIVSPFATMLVDFSNDQASDNATDTTEGEEKKPEDEKRIRNESGLETLKVQHDISLLSKPFLYNDLSEPRDLESLPDGIEEKPHRTKTPEKEHGANGSINGNIIEERGGVHYINREILNSDPKTGRGFNPDFKNLVDSVIK